VGVTVVLSAARRKVLARRSNESEAYGTVSGIAGIRRFSCAPYHGVSWKRIPNSLVGSATWSLPYGVCRMGSAVLRSRSSCANVAILRTHLEPAAGRVSGAASRPGHRLRFVFLRLLSLFFAPSAQAQFSVQATTLVFNYGAGTNVLPAQYLDVSGPFSATASVMTPIRS
jgi:hypothetical protein